MIRELGGVIATLFITGLCAVLLIVDVPQYVFEPVLKRLCFTVGLLTALLCIGLLFGDKWVVYLMPLLGVFFLATLAPLFTYWGSDDKNPIAFYGHSVFQVTAGMFILIVEYCWLWHRYIKVKR
ncbi:hypothetical protein [Shewanella sairae]|uniref:hypothetical protein n=1 Tax=Shewanella sairae TaxID=190310 RepID=UPI001C7FE7FE|nr:hypothetical protein [Shewanella sairae]MCL1132319.1 hypothetical protein [Shewanella sairae]